MVGGTDYYLLRALYSLIHLLPYCKYNRLQPIAISSTIRLLLNISLTNILTIRLAPLLNAQASPDCFCHCQTLPDADNVTEAFLLIHIWKEWASIPEKAIIGCSRSYIYHAWAAALLCSFAVRRNACSGYLPLGEACAPRRLMRRQRRVLDATA